MRVPLSSAQLAEKYPDERFTREVRRLLNVRKLMSECLIDADYKIPGDLHNAIVLSPDGEKLVETLVRNKNSVPYPEARLLCLLELWHTDILIDPIATRTDELIRAFGEQVRSLEVRYPYIFGRTLYDKAADQGIGARKPYLSAIESQEFLHGTPQGVFQCGAYVTGPYGILMSDDIRYLDPSSDIGYHCADLSCNDLHQLGLGTSWDARINKSREKVRKYLEQESEAPSEWTTFLRETNLDAPRAVYDDMRGDTIAFLVGDAMNESEQRHLLALLLESASEKMQTQMRSVGLIGCAAEIAETVGRAELLQLILLVPTKNIVGGIDRMALTGELKIPDDEVRIPVINLTASGPYGLYPELNRYGVRFRSAGMNIAPLRLRRLVAQMYPADNEQDRSELDWQLRSETAETLESKIEQYLHKRGPREAVSTLLLARRTNLIVATERLNVIDELLSTDGDRVNAVLWKLGFSIADNLDAHAQFWRYHSALNALCKPAAVNVPVVDVEQLRERSVNYFVTLEEILRDALLYTTWALTTDHYSARRKFAYNPELDSEEALQTLKSHVNGNKHLGVKLSSALTLYPLIHGFAVLAHHLESLQGREEDFARPPKDVPIWASAQDLQVFPFSHTVPFLDLLGESQSTILGDLRNVTDRLSNADVSDVRNALLHPRPADIARLRVALQAIEDVVKSLRSSGYLRQAFRPVRIEVDEAGRKTSVLADPYGETVLVNSPSYFDWVGLPGPSSGVHFMPAAYFQVPSGVLRFKTEPTSPYSELWGNYPRRQEKTSGTATLHRQRRPSSQATVL
jgi:hypothetical protein